MRIDGVIIDYVTLQRALHQPLIARIKIMSNLDIAEHRIPPGRPLPRTSRDRPRRHVRVSILPTVFGEKAVLRILSSNTYIKNASHFGMNDETYKRFLPLLNRPNGIVYLTGPTGSGKTTTLYMVLQTIAERQVNVSTIEDPVERNLARINQTQVNNIAGLTLRVVCAPAAPGPRRIMVGETRDAETASISVRAAITGHMVSQRCTQTTHCRPLSVWRIWVSSGTWSQTRRGPRGSASDAPRLPALRQADAGHGGGAHLFRA